MENHIRTSFHCRKFHRFRYRIPGELLVSLLGLETHKENLIKQQLIVTEYV